MGSPGRLAESWARRIGISLDGSRSMSAAPWYASSGRGCTLPTLPQGKGHRRSGLPLSTAQRTSRDLLQFRPGHE
jgi:hypothetical protein